MSLTAKNDPDHNLNTLTDVVRLLGETRAEMRQRFDQQDKRFDQQDKRFDQQDKRFDQQDKRFDQQDKNIAELKADSTEIKETLKLILSRLPAS